jgi:hypothetical protein
MLSVTAALNAITAFDGYLFEPFENVGGPDASARQATIGPGEQSLACN